MSEIPVTQGGPIKGRYPRVRLQSTCARVSGNGYFCKGRSYWEVFALKGRASFERACLILERILINGTSLPVNDTHLE